MVVADKTQSLTISGNGDVVEPNDGIVGMPFFSTPHTRPGQSLEDRTRNSLLLHAYLNSSFLQ